MPQTARKVRVLFLCTGNSCRSQMAEGWARHLKGDAIDAGSAGIETHRLDALAVQVMAEAGVDISGHRSKHVDEFRNVDFDYVVTVCDHARESCPLFPGTTRVVHRGFDDPPRFARNARSEEQALGHYRRVRDEIRAFVESLTAWTGFLSKPWPTNWLRSVSRFSSYLGTTIPMCPARFGSTPPGALLGMLRCCPKRSL